MPEMDGISQSSHSTSSSKKNKLSAMISRHHSDGSIKKKKEEIKVKKSQSDPFLPKRIGKSKSMNEKLDTKPSSSKKKSSSKKSASLSPKRGSGKRSSRLPPKKVSLIRSSNSSSSTDESSSQRSNRSTTSSKKSRLSSIISRPLSEQSFLSEGAKNKRKDKNNKMKQSKSDQFVPTRIGKSISMNEKCGNKPSSKSSRKKISSDKSASFHDEFSSRITSSRQNSANNSDDSSIISQRSSHSSNRSEKYRASQRRLESMSSKEKTARTKAIMDSLVSNFTTAQVTGANTTDNKSTIIESSSTTRKVQFNDNVRHLMKIDYSKFDRDQLWFSDAEISVHRNREQKLNRESANSPHLDVEGMFTLKERNVRTSRILQSNEAVFDMQLVNKKEKELHNGVGLFSGGEAPTESNHELALAEEYMLVSAPAMESAICRATHLELHVQLLWHPSTNKTDEPSSSSEQISTPSSKIRKKGKKSPKRKKSTQVLGDTRSSFSRLVQSARIAMNDIQERHTLV